MALEIALTESERPISFCFRQRLHKRFINLSQINRRGHSNYTTKAYASSRPKTHRAHILSSTTTLYARARDWSVEVGDDEVYHINQTPPRAGTPHLHSKCKGQAPEPCTYYVNAAFPLKRMRPEQATLVRRSGIIKSKDGVFLLNSLT